MIDSSPLHIFVAVPGRSDTALWNDRQEIKSLYFEGIRQELAHILERQVVLTVEADRRASTDVLSLCLQHVGYPM